jgi:hypothetical protein
MVVVYQFLKPSTKEHVLQYQNNIAPSPSLANPCKLRQGHNDVAEQIRLTVTILQVYVRLYHKTISPSAFVVYADRRLM